LFYTLVYNTPRKTNNFLESLILQISILIELDNKMKGKK